MSCMEILTNMMNEDEQRKTSGQRRGIQQVNNFSDPLLFFVNVFLGFFRHVISFFHSFFHLLPKVRPTLTHSSCRCLLLRNNFKNVLIFDGIALRTFFDRELRLSCGQKEYLCSFIVYNSGFIQDFYIHMMSSCH